MSRDISSSSRVCAGCRRPDLPDRPREVCGVFGVAADPRAAELTFLGLYALQHRGQEGAGIVATDGVRLSREAGPGLVADVFARSERLARLPGRSAIGHNRYSTTGLNVAANIQPILVKTRSGPIALAHNGNLTNSRLLRRSLEEQGSIFQTTTDSEIILHLMAKKAREGVVESALAALQTVTGAFSLVMLTPELLLAARDPQGFKPLCLGRLESGAPVVASESCALDIIGAEYQRDVEPGELLEINSAGEIRSHRISAPARRAHCVFEYIYFSRPDSRIYGDNVDKTRRKLGKNLAMEQPVDADITIPVPDSSNTAAIGYSRRTNTKFDLGLIRNHYVGRTFINPLQHERDFSVNLKFNIVHGVLRGRKVVVVDDSLVRGTTLRKLVGLIRSAGPREVHIRISSPPVRYPCYFGMDFPDPAELLANRFDPEAMRRYLDVESVAYLSVEGLKASLSQPPGDFCMACFTGEYPVSIPDLEAGGVLPKDPDSLPEKSS